MRRISTVFVCLFLFLGYSSVCSASVLLVPDDYTTIQEAIDAAYPYDVIRIRPGEYAGFSINNKQSIKLESTDYNLKPLIWESCTILNSDGVTLLNLNISSLSSYSGGEITIEECVLKDGIHMAADQGEPFIYVRNCTFYPQSETMAAFVASSGHPAPDDYPMNVVFSNNTFVDCDTAIAAGRASIHWKPYDVHLIDNTFINCQTELEDFGWSGITWVELDDEIAEGVDRSDLSFARGSWHLVPGSDDYVAVDDGLSDNEESYIQTHIQLDQPSRISFRMKVSSERGYDYLTFDLDDTEMERISGESGWITRSYDVSAGGHLLRWQYSKDSSVSAGEDKAYVDHLAIMPIDEEHYTGYLNGKGDYDYHIHPYFYSENGYHSARLVGPGGTDFDLALHRWNGSGWITVASSTSGSSIEEVNSYYGNDGWYRWKVYSYHGSGDYDIWLTKP